MSDDRDPGAPSLEPPSLFRRKRKPKAAPEPAPEPVPEAQPTPEEPTAVLPVAEPEPAPPEPAPTPVAEAKPAPPLFADEVAPEPEPEPEPETAPAPAPAPKVPREPRGPLLTGLPAALATGLVVGLLVVGLTAGGQRGCEAVQGTSSCGGAGYPLILAILIVAVLVGGALLRWSTVPDPGSTSFLAVGLLAVIALLFLVEQLDSWWMLGVIPVVAMATYAASHWVTTAVIEPARE